MRFRLLLLLAVLLLCLLGCNNEGVTPPASEINFPIDLVMSTDGAFLYVANSNFDLRYNGGSVQSFDLAQVTTDLPDSTPAPMELTLAPTSEVIIGSHAAALATNPDGTRLYVAVRSDSNLTFIDLPAGGALACGQGQGRNCADSFRRGDERAANERNVVLPRDPTGLAVGRLSDLNPAASSDATYLLVSHRRGQASLFFDGADTATTSPVLVQVASNLSDNLVTAVMETSTNTLWLPSSSEGVLGRARIAIDPSDLARTFVTDVGPAAVVGVADGRDIRDVRFRTQASGEREAFVLTRRPEAILTVNLDRSPRGSLEIRRVTPVGFGPSRMEMGTFDLPRGARTLLFATCYDSRDIHVMDADSGTLVSVIRGMSGPFELAIDQGRQRIYVADFRASVIRVVSLAPLLSCLDRGAEASCEPRLLGSIGVPRSVGEQL